MEESQRIASFRKMVAADPQNELGHFSLGIALFDACSWDESRACFEAALKRNPGFSKAYQLLGECWDRLGKREAAISAWKKGWEVANSRGDLMPREAMAKRLKECGESIPQPESRSAAQAPGAVVVASSPDHVACARCGRSAPRLSAPPLPGAMGERILRSTCKDCWSEWLAMGVKVINELQLDLTSFAGATAFDKHMAEFLRIEA